MACLRTVLYFSLFSVVFSDSIYQNVMRYEEYDYIIVGAGSTGSVIASRLSEDSRLKVLLLEAGGTPPNKSEIPLLAYELSGTEADWQYVTAPQEQACLAFPNKTNPMPRGKVLGGSSILNCMLYVKGNRDDYNDWAQQGAKGWAWNDVSHYFSMSENQTNATLLSDGFHETGGPLTVSTNSYVTPIRDKIVDAAANSGYDIVDYNGEDQIGVGVVQATIRDGRRCSTEKAFLRSAAPRENIDILQHAFVTKIEFEGKTARNVSFDFNNSSRSVRARKEIILSAGTIGSPQILMLSGVGPKEHLEEMGIPVVADLPVGQNLQDHIRESGLLYYFKQHVSLVFSRDVNQETYEEFKDGKGPLTVPCGAELLGFLRTKYQNDSDQRPDIEVAFLAPVVYPDSSQDKLMNASKLDVMALYPTLIRPASTGFIKLKSTDPYEHPIIDPQYLTEHSDVLRLIEGIKMTKALMDSPEIQKYSPELRRQDSPGCGPVNLDNDTYLECAIRAWTHSADHQTGTCKMGNTSDPTTVVDTDLRVKGVNNLRVADASIMPSVTSGNTNAPCIMIGEKAAELIRWSSWD